MKPEYAKKQEKQLIQFFKSVDYYGESKLFESIYIKSKKNINFKNILNVIETKENMLIAIRCIRGNSTIETKGPDSQSFSELIQTYSSDELLTLIKEKLKHYKTSGVRRVYIPKSNNDKRPLEIPNAIDKLIQQMIKQVLEPYCEGKFYRHSYGFRPTRTVSEALGRCHNLVQNARCEYCVDISIKGFYDNINHNKLIKQMWTLGIRDKKLLMIIKTILKSPIDGIPQEKGLLQDGILSPLLSNIVLNELDHWVANQWEDFINHTDSKKKKRRIL